MTCIDLSRFNSILVRLKVCIRRYHGKDDFRFNSILVRLKVELSKMEIEEVKVSIPYWFD